MVAQRRPEFECESSNAPDNVQSPTTKSDSAFRSIGEAANELGLKTHVLRFWETKFPQISPMKRKDGRRYYRSEDISTLRTIQSLLHDRGMTIRGAQKLLQEKGSGQGASGAPKIALEAATGQSVRELQSKVRDAVSGGTFDVAQKDDAAAERLGRLLTDLTDLKARLDTVRTAN